jgi:hypothetical protein
MGSKYFGVASMLARIMSGNAIGVQDSLLTSSKDTMFYLQHDHLVKDVVLLLSRLCHQSWMITPLSMIPLDSMAGTC